MRSSRAALLAALYFASGAGALLLESVWLRWFRLAFGATAPAASATLVAFFAGGALGAALAARWLPRVRRPLRAYGLLELAAAASALAVPLVLDAGQALLLRSYDALADAPAPLALARLAIALAATLPAAACAGATFPVIGAALVREPGALGRGGAGLYAVNLLGAALGAALAAFWLPDRIGVPATHAAGAALLAAVGGAALLVARGGAAGAPRAAPASGGTAPVGTGPGAALLGLAALSGFGALGAQVLWVHAFALVLNQSVFAFGAVLVAVLVCLAAGSGLVSASERRRALDPRALLAGSLVASAVGLAAFPALFYRLSHGLAYVGTGALGGYAGAALAAVAQSAGLPLLAAALVFPALFAVAGRARGRAAGAAPGVVLGRLAAANTAGAIAGALLTPYLLLPAAGLWGSFLALAGVYAVAALGVEGTRRARGARAAALAVAGGAALALGNPLAPEPGAPGEAILFAQETPAGAVAVVEREGERLLRIDNHYALGGSSERVHEERQGHLPLLLHPAPRRVAFLGSATAITAGAALAHPVESIRLVELVPGVARAAARFFGPWNRGVAADPRTRSVLDDARNYVRATAERFDVVVGDLFVPWRSGASALYAREHFEAVRAHLAPGGLFAQWLPLYQLSEREFLIVAATFRDSFPRAGVFRGDFFGDYPIVALVGFGGEPAEAAAVGAAARRLRETGETDRWVVDPRGVFALYAGPLAALAAPLDAAPRNSDAFPRLEYLAARGHAGGRLGKREPLVGLRWSRLSQPLAAAAGRGGDPLYPDLPPELRRAAEAGALLQLAGGLWQARRADEAARALAGAAERLPAALLAEAPPDPTAADVWPE